MCQDKKPHIEFGRRLQKIRKKLGLKQLEMAESLDIATSTYQYYERGEREAPFTIIKKLTTFGVNSSWLITGKKETNFDIGNDESKEGTTAGKPPHSAIIHNFQQNEFAGDILYGLLKLGQFKPEALQEVSDFIKFKIAMYDRRHGERRRNDASDFDPDEERRSGQERRKAVGS